MVFSKFNSSNLSIFRTLPQTLRERITPAHIDVIVRLKTHFLSKLTYTQKCQITQNEMAGMLYEQLFWERGFSLQVILEILRAEESYFFSSCELFMDDEFMYSEAA